MQGRKPGASLDTRKRLSVSPLKPGFKLRVEDVSGNIGQALVGGSPGLSLGGGGSPHTRSFGTSGAPSPIARAATTRATVLSDRSAHEEKARQKPWLRMRTITRRRRQPLGRSARATLRDRGRHVVLGARAPPRG